MAKRKDFIDELGDTAKVEADARVKILQRENEALRRKLSERDSKTDIFRHAVEEAFKDVQPLTIRKPPKQSTKKGVEEAVLHLTDVHFGKRTATYGMAIAEQRIIEAGIRTIELTNLRRNNARIDHLHLFLGGDMAEGEGEIFPGQSHEIDVDVIEQACREGPRIIAELILSLLQEFERITVKGVPGNHGRTSRNAAKRNNFDNWFYVVLRLSTVACLNEPDRQRVVWDLPTDRTSGCEWWAYDVVSGRWGTLLVHGDQIRGQLGMPWYGFGKKANGWIDTIPHSWNYLFSGHFHTQATFTINKRIICSTGTTESSNAYAAESLAASGEPTQRLCFFNEKYGLISDDPLYLSERQPNR